METSLILVKPDGVERRLAGEIIARIERAGLTIRGMRLTLVSRKEAERHYAEHRGKPFYDGLVEYITSAPVVALAVAGENAVAKMRSLIGATNPLEAAPGTIRGDYGLVIAANLVHGSANLDDAERELQIFFPEGLLG